MQAPHNWIAVTMGGKDTCQRFVSIGLVLPGEHLQMGGPNALVLGPLTQPFQAGMASRHPLYAMGIQTPAANLEPRWGLGINEENVLTLRICNDASAALVHAGTLLYK